MHARLFHYRVAFVVAHKLGQIEFQTLRHPRRSHIREMYANAKYAEALWGYGKEEHAAQLRAGNE